MSKEKHYLIFNQNNVAVIDSEPVIEKIKHLKHHKIADINNVEYIAVEIEQELSSSITTEFMSLRQACTLLGENFYPILSKAFQVIHWDKQHQFCSVCGSKTIHKENTWEKHCLKCESIFYPRIAPSIIVLIKKDDEILMARSPHFPPGVYGLIAGFVEPGETIEETVHREVMEEVGINIKNLQYYGSQSWPFPNTLMIGFIADYASGDIHIDPIEIEAAGWFKADNLPGLPSSTFSIGYKMIHKFLTSAR